MALDAVVQDFAAADGAPRAAVAPPRQWNVLSRLEKGASGRRLPDGPLRVARSEPAGCVLYGPYMHLPEGRYRLAFRCECRSPRWSGQPVLGVEVIVLSRFQRVWRDFTAAELAEGLAFIDFEVPREHSLEGENEGRFEFRFFHLGNADLTIAAVTVEALAEDQDEDEPPPLTESRWRLLGRLQTSWRARRGGEGGIAVWRRAPAGCAAFGLWPLLRLPRGTYRLRVAGRIGTPRQAGQPVLAIEILGRNKRTDGIPLLRMPPRPDRNATREAWQVFRAEDFAAGPVSFDFSVPTELALEAGADAPFDIRLHHLGNAALHIAAVELEKFGPEAALLPEPVPGGIRPRAAKARRKVVIVGNCQSETLRQGLANNDAFAGFEVKYHFVQLPRNLYEFAARDLETCDVLLIQDIRLWDEFPLREAVPPGADRARFPLVRFSSLWPFDAWNGPGDKEAHEREAPNLTFPYLDGLLGRLRREIPDPERRFQAYRSLDIPGVVNYARLHKLEEKRLIGLDRQFGVAIGGYILENFQNRRVFHTTVRPDWQVFSLLLQFVGGLLGVKEAISLPKTADLLLRNPQVPVHPKVARDLGVRWIDDNTRYLDHGIAVSWEDYIRRYIAHYG